MTRTQAEIHAKATAYDGHTAYVMRKVPPYVKHRQRTGNP